MNDDIRGLGSATAGMQQTPHISNGYDNGRASVDPSPVALPEPSTTILLTSGSDEESIDDASFDADGARGGVDDDAKFSKDDNASAIVESYLFRAASPPTCVKEVNRQLEGRTDDYERLRSAPIAILDSGKAGEGLFDQSPSTLSPMLYSSSSTSTIIPTSPLKSQEHLKNHSTNSHLSIDNYRFPDRSASHNSNPIRRSSSSAAIDSPAAVAEPYTFDSHYGGEGEEFPWSSAWAVGGSKSMNSRNVDTWTPLIARLGLTSRFSDATEESTRDSVSSRSPSYSFPSSLGRRATIEPVESPGGSSEGGRAGGACRNRREESNDMTIIPATASATRSNSLSYRLVDASVQTSSRMVSQSTQTNDEELDDEDDTLQDNTRVLLS